MRRPERVVGRKERKRTGHGRRLGAGVPYSGVATGRIRLRCVDPGLPDGGLARGGLACGSLARGGLARGWRFWLRLPHQPARVRRGMLCVVRKRTWLGSVQAGGIERRCRWVAGGGGGRVVGVDRVEVLEQLIVVLRNPAVSQQSG